MASADVAMQEVEEVVIVTIPEGTTEELPGVVEGDDEEVDDVKTVLVTTELSQQRGDEVFAVVPVESEDDAGDSNTLLKDESVIVKLTEEVDVESDVFYPITCGDTKALLVWKKFVCPGINIKCVQFNEQLISPKEFVCLAGKSTLKDWKRAIRLNGTMLRKIMDSGELDFYQHAKVCSNTCRSTKIDLVGNKMSVSSQQSTEFVPVTTSPAELNGLPAKFTDRTEESSEWVTAIGEDSVLFWCGVKEAGLLDEVVEDFQKELKVVLKGLQERVSDPPLLFKDAVLLNNIVQNFGMLDLVKKVLASHKSQMDRYREQYTRSLAALEQQCDEHRKRAKELKNKSQHLNNVLMTLAPAPPSTPLAPKRPRLSRSMSGPAAPGASPTQITLSLNQLAATSLPIGKVLAVASSPASCSLGGGYTLLTSPVGTAELASDASGLSAISVATGVQEGTPVGGAPGPMAFVKVVGPQYQLVTLPPALGATLQGPGAPQRAVVPLPVNNVSVVSSGAITSGHTDSTAQADTEPTDVQQPQEISDAQQLDEGQ